MIEFCDSENAKLSETQQVPEVGQNVEIVEIDENVPVMENIQEETQDDNEKLLLELYAKLLNPENCIRGRGKKDPFFVQLLLAEKFSAMK